MENKTKKNHTWIGIDQLENAAAFEEAAAREFPDLPVGKEVDKVAANRRDFLKFLGFSLGAATIAASCDIPVKRAIPYVVKPDTIVPGVATYYASSFVNGGDYCAVLVKTREGRPIKIEGNSLSNVTYGGTSARAQAVVLSLYDTNRFAGPGKMEQGRFTQQSWKDVDQAVMNSLTANSHIRIVTHTLLSPTAKKVLEEFQAAYPNAKVVTYDPVSASALIQANEACFGQRVVPNYRFDQADVIVSFGADFLGTWISPVEYARQYAANRKIEDVHKAKMSRHYQVEAAMTLTGSNADHRILVKPSEQGAAIAALYNELARKAGQPTVSAPKVNDKAAAMLKQAAEDLWRHRGQSLVVSGTNNIGEQILVNAINNMLGNIGKTVRFANASLQRQGIDRDVQQLIGEMNKGAVDAVFFWGANPAYELPNADAFAEALQKVKLKVSFSGMPDETTALCDYVAPTHHLLESWGDAEPKRGMYSLIQPTIAPLFDTRQAEETLLRWAESANLNTQTEQPYYEYLKATWEHDMFPRQTKYATFQRFWDMSLHDGVFELEEQEPQVSFAGDVQAAAAKVTKPANSELEIQFVETVNIGNGQYADNPWLMELPDPINRCVWDNYLMVPVVFDGHRHFDGEGPFAGFNQEEFYGFADKAEIEVAGRKAVLPVVRQFGQMRGTVGLALGYGRRVAGKAGVGVGVDANPWLTIDADGNTQYYNTDVKVLGKAGKYEMACVQYHHTMGVTGKKEGSDEVINVDEQAVTTIKEGYQGGLVDRTIIRRANLSELDKFVEELKEERHEAEHLNQQTLYPYEEYKEKYYSQGHHWGMHIDLNACIGCGACEVACMAENNVPVVGKYEVFRHHEMTWLRIDRYFFGDYENPNVVYQPMMCQHCDNAPCENVCPVSATNHSAEGLNQMAYNRCIGTRYCANNCPYKVRRFNWLDYTTADLFPINENEVNGEVVYADNLVRMVLNPDVTVRERGVMEKCSFCVQRIQEGKLTAKREGRKLEDHDVKTACQTACPTGAITFGDTNNEKSAVRQQYNSELNYVVLEEIGVRPSVQYKAKVTNKVEALG